MANLDIVGDMDRNRAWWWLVVVTLALSVAFILYSFVGTFVLALFFYYAVRPLYDKVHENTNSDSIAATVTMAGVVLPVLGLLAYTGFVLVSSLSGGGGGTMVSLPAAFEGALQRYFGIGPLPKGQWQFVTDLTQNPVQTLRQNAGSLQQFLAQGAQVLSIVATGLLHLSLALSLAFFLLRDDDRITKWFEHRIASEGTAGHAYVNAIDNDLETIFYGNLVFVGVMSVIAAVVYYGVNILGPEGVNIPIPLVLAVLTGVSSLVPIVVGKLVYIPVVGYLTLMTMQNPNVGYGFPLVVLVVCVLALDLFPQMAIQPYITGRKIHVGLLMFSYIFGPMLFGWYGFFFLPMIVMVVVETVRFVLSELVHGDPITPKIRGAPSLGTDTTSSPPSDD